MPNSEYLSKLPNIKNMSDEEKSVLTKIFDEYSSGGSSDTLEALWYADYEEIPVDIYTFMTDSNFLGASTDGGEAIYPFWMKTLDKLFQPNAKIFEAILTGAIGIGKTTAAIFGIAYMLYKLLCLRDPQRYYGLTSGSKIVIAFFNVTLDLSEGVAYSKLQKALLSSPWFRRHGTVRGLKEQFYVPNKNIEFRLGSEEQHGLGQDIFCLVGGTEVTTTTGIYKIEDLVDKQIFVYSYDSSVGYIKISNKCTVIKNGYASELIEIEFINDAIVRCTPDHRWLTSEGVYKKASELSPGEDILSV